MSLQIDALNKSFQGHQVLQDIELEVGASEFVCLLGPSGCGKTTLLRIIAGLLAADSGSITLGGRNLATLPARERGFGIVFQSYSLFPHLTVAQNVGYGLAIRRTPAQQVGQRVAQLLATVKLDGFGPRYPAQLSGGQQQRVAMARALAVNPALLLLDEPLSALDARVRNDLRAELTEVQRQLGIPTLMVTHDQAEAMSMAHRIVCMNQGRIEQVGSPQQLYLQPRTRFVANFMGHSNLLSLAQLQALWPELLSQAPAGMQEGTAAVCVRPEKLRVTADPAGAARVRSSSFLGSIQHLTLDCAGQTLLAEVGSSARFAPGQALRVEVRAPDCAWLQS
ncbi:MAG: ATP-binding cassette domain-containing protein [Gammaproteobacteria bacterium]|nr:ATP-binding cassette domain-containing protein [Gammaproteobacteria bacterium]